MQVRPGEYGVEAQFLLNGDLSIARTFRDQPDFGLGGRDLAIAWAEAQRKIREKPRKTASPTARATLIDASNASAWCQRRLKI